MPHASYLKNNRGFSLIEMVVVIAVLLIVVLTTIDIFLGILRQQKRLLQEQELLNQTSYVLEYMSRALRMAIKDGDGACLGSGNVGKNYVLTDVNEDGIKDGIKFINHSNNDICQEFFWDPVLKTLNEKRTDTTESVPLTPGSLSVNYFNVRAYGASGSDNYQPRITFSMELRANGTGDQPKKQIQTTISQRNLDE